jgi:hypothetical protein
MKLLLLAFCMLPMSLFAAPPGEKYAIGLFHFNFQYVAGDYKIERRIIRESLFPVLQFFDRHPEYRSDIEMQGYAIEVLATEHPDVFALLKKLVRRGQIELVVAHYSDQLFIGYPAEDLRRSIALSDSILVRYGIQRSAVFFGQEFQWSPALASALKGKYDVVVTSSDPNNWYEGGGSPLVNVVYGQDTIRGLIGGGAKDLPGLAWRIAFLDDGEEFNTKDYNSDFYRVPAQEQENMDKYKKLLAEGYRFVTVSELVRRMSHDTAYRAPVYPFVPEGTWHMKVCGPFMWMGRQRSGVETDGITRAVSYRLRGEVMLAEAMVAYAERQGKDVGVLREWLKQAWEHLLLSEVSDSSGWDPWLVEVQYTDNEAATAWKLIAQIMEQLRKLLSVPARGWTVDTKSGAVAASASGSADAGGSGAAGGLSGTAGGLDGSAAGVPAALPVDCAVRAEKYTASVRQLDDSVYRLDIECTRPADGAVEISFRTAGEGLRYSPSCGEDRSVVIPTGFPHDPAFALANGFIYLNNGYSLVKDCSVEHLAATWRVKERQLVFREELREGNNTMHMRFYIVKGTAERGLAFSNVLNTYPVYGIDSNWVWSKKVPL